MVYCVLPNIDTNSCYILLCSGKCDFSVVLLVVIIHSCAFSMLSFSIWASASTAKACMCWVISLYFLCYLEYPII